jgi:glycosyltransferase involved in cell wall biosynthesis
MTFTAVAGPEHERYLREAALDLPDDPRLRLHGFTSDMLPFYQAANLVVVPAKVSAGTNLKVLEAIAMRRALVSTSRGCAGIGLEHGSTVLIADDAGGFAEAVAFLAADTGARTRMADAAFRYASGTFGWPRLGEKQRALYRELRSGTTIE